MDRFCSVVSYLEKTSEHYSNKTVPKVVLQQNYVQVLCPAPALFSPLAVLPDRENQFIPSVLLSHKAANICQTDFFMLMNIFIQCPTGWNVAQPEVMPGK